MEGLGFVGIVIIVFGILQIILFFKLWGMTNDVSKLRDLFTPKISYFEIRKCIIVEDTAKAKEIMISSFFKKISTGNYEFLTAKKELEENLKKINEEIPEKLKNINSYSEFNDLF